VYGKTLNPESVRLSPFYAVSEVYAFAAAAENQFLNMMTKILENRMEDIMREGIQGTTLTQNTLPERINIQYDRSVLDAHSNRIRNILAFLRVADDPVWFPPLKDSASDEVAEVQRSLIHDFQHLQTQVVQLIQRCERAMELIAHNASLSEAKRSNLQSEGLQKLTRLTTVVTLLYVPLSFVCSFFGMNFSAFGQGELGLWIWAVVSVPVLLVSLFFLKRRLSNSSTMERSSKKWYQWMKIRG
jgi:Mg2+ and Co2+ transporter CorA